MAYEAVPEHNRMYVLGDMDRKDHPIRAVLYPDEYHVYAAAGRPDRRIDRNRRIIDWFDRYLR